MLLRLKRLVVGLRLGPPVLVVSGLPRSGTSMMMKMLAAAGVEVVTDEIRTADADNPRGYFEYERVKELDKAEDKSWVLEHRGKALKVVSSLLEQLPDTCRYRVVLMRRDLAEVIASQNKMLARRGESGGGTPDDKMKQNYERHLRKLVLSLAARPNFELLEVDYAEVVRDPQGQAARVARFFGLGERVPAMAAAVDRELYRNRAGSRPTT